MNEYQAKTIEAVTEVRLRSIRVNGPKWSKNMGKNWPHVQKPYFEATSEFGEWITQENLVIFSSGPSLSRYAGEIAKINNNSIIVATPTNVPWLLSQGVRIDLVVIADAHPAMAAKLKGYDGPIICPPTVDHAITELPNNKYWFKLLMGNGQSSDPTFGIWNLVQNGMFQNLVSGYLAEHACVTNMALAICADLMAGRYLMGKRIIMAGIDYCYWNDWARIDETLRPRPLEIDAMEWGGYQSNARMVLYKDRLINLWSQLHQIPMYSMSEGIVHEIPKVTLDDVMNGTYPAQPSIEEVKEKVEAHRGEFLEKFGKQMEEK